MFRRSRGGALAVLLGAVLFAALVALGAMALVVPDRGAPAEPVAPSPPPRTAAPRPSAAVEVPSAGGATSRDAVGAGVASVNAVCAVRCVSWDGEPLPGCVVRAAGVTAMSDASGEARVAVPVGSAVALHVEGEGWLGAVRTVVVPIGGAHLGDVRLRRGAIVVGVVTDPRQQPYGAVLVQLQWRDHAARDDGWSERWPMQATTADDGTFSFAAPVPPGRASVHCDGAPPLAGSGEHVLHAGALNHLELVCRASAPGDWIIGSVHEPGGAPVAGALVQASAGDGASGAAARTDDEGAFRLYRGDAAPGDAWLTATSLAQDRCAERVGPVRWGARDVAIELPDGSALQLHVSDAATGAPIDRFTVQCVRATGVRGENAARRRARPGGAGIAWLDGVPAGPGRLVVWPDDARWLPSPEVAFDHGGASVVHVVLPRAEQCPVLVRTASGRPLPGVHVELLLPAASDVVRDLATMYENGGVRSPVNVRLARGTTGADGRALLRWFDDPRPLQLRVHGPGASPHVESGVHIGPLGHTVVVADTGRIELVLNGGSGARVVLEEAGGARVLPPAWAAPLALDDTGRAGADVPAGTWRVSLQRQLAVNGQRSPVWLRAPAPLATVVVAAGGTQRIERDVAEALAPAELTGTAFVDGEPAGTVVLMCGEADAGSRDGVRVRHAVEGHTDARGAFVFAGLPAGVYSVELRVRSGNAQIAVPHGQWVHVAAGERRQHAEVAVATGAVTIRVRGDGVAGRCVELAAPPGIALIGTLDASGAVRLERVPAASYRVRLRGSEGSAELGTAAVTGGGAQTFVFDAR